MLYDKLLAYLRAWPIACERMFKDRGIVNILLEKYPDLKVIEKQILVDFVRDHNSYDRLWRKIMECEPSMRGSDYSDGKVYASEKQKELGYESNYYQDKKALKRI